MEQVHFYQKLYENPRTYERRNLDDFVKDVNIPKLSVEDSSNCEGVIELNECTNALKQMKNSSSPGLDGLSAAFYKVFWCKIQKMVLDSLNRGYNNGQLSCSQREGLITLLPKKDLPRKFLKNWRPLTLTNVDYKMAASVMAIRIKKVITKIIHEDQCGYIKGRSSCTILRNIDDVITYLNDTDQQGIFLAIDYTKAFDSIYKDFMYDSLKLFGFGDSLIQWVKTLNENCTSSMNYNGWIHGNIKLERGIKQGCPLSPLLYIIASEILSCGIRQNRNINGVILPQNKETKVLQYADDTSMFLKDCKSLIYTFKYFDIFTVVSGLKINRDKTEAMWLGKWKKRQTNVSNLKWKLFPNNKITLLGITFSSTANVINLEENIEPKIVKIEKIMKMWLLRNLTIFGRITLVKSLIASQFLYLMQSFILPTHVLTRINTMFFKFIWSKGKYKEADLKNVPEKVKRDIVVQDYNNGGLKMIDMIDIQTAFAFKWIKLLYINGNGTWRCLPNYYLGQFSTETTIFNCNTGNVTSTAIPEFYQKVLHLWNKNKTDVDKSILWNNDLIKISGKVLCFQNWIKKGINFIRDVTFDRRLMTYDEICEKIDRNPRTLIQYLGLRSALSYNIIQEYGQKQGDTNVYFNKKHITKCTASDFRHFIVKKRSLDVMFENVEITNDVWLRGFKCTKQTKLLVIHWKTLHNIYQCNVNLYRFRLKENKLCNNCNVDDTIRHHFVHCQKIKHVWNNFNNLNQNQILGIEACQNYKEVLIARRAIEICHSKDINNVNAIFETEKQIRAKN